MPTVVTLKNEKSVREIAARVFATSSAASLDRAEKALLRANPQLKTAAGFRTGAVISVPQVGDLALRADAIGQDPLEALRGALVEAAAGFRKHLAKSLDARSSALDAQHELLKTRQIAAAINTAPGGPELQKQLNETLSQRAKSIAAERKSQDALFDRIVADLKALDLK